ncbi:MAG: site-specific DNA-methyltransferase, partial [Clostridiales bacterium]|nr:site-specific DNA-methyltransferase [Clostridiales bacterium]
MEKEGKEIQEDMQRSPRNKTITLSPEEERFYLTQCLRQEDLLPRHSSKDAIVLGDCFSVMETLAEGFADLLIADPPYNLDKTFGSSKFNKMDAAGYEAFTRRWIEAVLPALKETASIYICCDWKSSLIIGPVLRDYALLRNRITWQR